MPGAVWFPGAQVNYAQQVFRHADAAHAAGHPAIVFRDEAMQLAGRIAGDRLARAAAPGRCIRRRARGDGRRPRRSRRRLHAEHAADGGRLSRLRQPRARSGRSARADMGAARACSTAFARSSRRCWSPATATATAVSRTTGCGAARGRRRAAERERCRPLARSRCRRRRGRCSATPTRRVHDFAALVARRRARAAAGCRSTIRSGSSTRAARPACRSRSSTATAASCSSR